MTTLDGTVVQKYGGSSLATCELIRGVAGKVTRVHGSGRPVVVVVSARGDTTDVLLAMAAQIGGPRARGREVDQLLATGESASAALLSLALLERGVPAVSLCGAQTEILVSGEYGSGRIAAIDTTRLRRSLTDGNVVVVAGFQGINDQGDVVTLGRGGSDTTAVALAAELGVPTCEIYTDVDGVFSADPRVVGEPSVLRTVDDTVMAEMSFAGARVMHSRAVELAALHGVAIHVGRSATGRIGTVIGRGDARDMLETTSAVMAVVHDQDVAHVELSCGRAAATPAEVFTALANGGIAVDMVALRETGADAFTIGMTTRRTDAPAARATLAPYATGEVDVYDRVGKVSVVGTGLLNRPEYAAWMLDALTLANITTRSVTASQSRVCVTVPDDDVVRAVRLLHRRFGLDKAAPSPLATASA